jgi:MFS family permease
MEQKGDNIQSGRGADKQEVQAGAPAAAVTPAGLAPGAAPDVSAGPTPSQKVLFWASFITLIAAGMGFSIRGDILADWGRDFGFTQTELGVITGQGLAGFGITIIFFSFFADLFGYGKLMVVAFALHALSVVLTLAAPMAFQHFGKAGAFNCLYWGAWSFSLANGTCEAVINPLTATLFRKNKTHWLNILHAGWPGGLVLGALVGLALNALTQSVPWINWQVRWGIVFAPMLLYGVMMLGRKFPASEAKVSAVGIRGMMGEVGLLGAAVAVALLGLLLSGTALPALLKSLNLPESLSWIGWAAAAALWIGFGSLSRFRIGHWVLAFLYVLHALVGYVELGTDSWIQDITKTVLSNERIQLNLLLFNTDIRGGDLALLAFIWVNVLMFTLRFFAGPIVHKISPVGLLLGSATLGTLGLLLLGMPATGTIWLWMGAVTIYGLGKTFYWPTMLGVVSERYPKGGALALGFSGGIGMLAAGILGGPMIGYKQDFAATRKLQETDKAAYERYRADKPNAAPIPGLPDIAGLDNSRVAVLNDDGKQLAQDLKRSPSDENLVRLNQWWEEDAREHAASDQPAVRAATLHGDRMALTWTAAVPAAMALGYLVLLIYFLARGGYKAEVLVGHAAQDEKFTGGTEGPGEG